MASKFTVKIDPQKFERLYRIELAVLYCQVPKEQLTEEQINGVYIPPIVAAAMVALGESLTVEDQI